MYGFVKHSLDCSEIVERTEVSHPGALSEPEAGYAWTEVPVPVSGWTVTLGEDGKPIPSPYVRPEAVRLKLGKLALHEQVKQLRDHHTQAGVTVPPHGTFDSDPDSQRKISGSAVMAMLAIQNSEPFSLDWRLQDNSIVALDAMQMIAVGVAVGQHIAACQYCKNALDALIDAAEDVEALEAIDIEAGWPA